MKVLKASDIIIRDPFVLPVPSRGLYYLFGTTDSEPWDVEAGIGFDCYASRDLEVWEGPFPAFRPAPGFWSKGQFWAPEVYAYRGEYYMFATFAAPGRNRGTQVLRAVRPEGPYLPLTAKPVTPASMSCLDGTLYLDEGKRPWMVFCHEWTQIGDGAICVMPLSDDLSRAAGEVRTLFHASDAPWVRPLKPGKYVTDGPYLYRDRGKLLMLWSSAGEHGYAMGLAESASGTLFGPWIHRSTPVFGRDGGHGMRFLNFDGRPMLTVHQPNTPGREHPAVMEAWF